MLKLRSQRLRRPGSKGRGKFALRSCEFPLRGVYAHLSVRTVCLPVLHRSSGQVEEDTTPELLEVELTLPRGAEMSRPVTLVQDGDNATAIAYGLMASDNARPQGAATVSRQVVDEVVGVVWTPTRGASLNGDAGFGVRSG